jgi:ribosomal protein S18 acetylase RimI-like enzyme
MKNVNIINESISYEIFIGEYQGIVTNTDTVDFYNYSHIDYWDNCINELGKKYKRVSLIDVIKIKKEFRGMGYGKKLIDIMISKSKEFGSEAIILMVDVLEPNTFDLVDWYEKKGFNLYGEKGQALPIMIKEL